MGFWLVFVQWTGSLTAPPASVQAYHFMVSLDDTVFAIILGKSRLAHLLVCCNQAYISAHNILGNVAHWHYSLHQCNAGLLLKHAASCALLVYDDCTHHDAQDKHKHMAADTHHTDFCCTEDG